MLCVRGVAATRAGRLVLVCSPRGLTGGWVALFIASFGFCEVFAGLAIRSAEREVFCAFGNVIGNFLTFEEI